ncbi:hypothetical protein LPJ66_007007 [Kickxella alabastrina]|uniref:Uncharacterized protein n=1 Tax=Kickxella alabastrina TaxID=61397 RepID=A0ACC1ICK0_9FUNG|nr:hypothetical protein LPJ66_007007 [Kickxella alabastrina]
MCKAVHAYLSHEASSNPKPQKLTRKPSHQLVRKSCASAFIKTTGTKSKVADADALIIHVDDGYFSNNSAHIRGLETYALEHENTRSEPSDARRKLEVLTNTKAADGQATATLAHELGNAPHPIEELDNTEAVLAQINEALTSQLDDAHHAIEELCQHANLSEAALTNAETRNKALEDRLESANESSFKQELAKINHMVTDKNNKLERERKRSSKLNRKYMNASIENTKLSKGVNDTVLLLKALQAKFQNPARIAALVVTFQYARNHRCQP